MLIVKQPYGCVGIDCEIKLSINFSSKTAKILAQMLNCTFSVQHFIKNGIKIKVQH